MEVTISQAFDWTAHGLLIVALVYILQEVIPNSKLMNKIYPPASVFAFRFFITLACIACGYDMLVKHKSELSSVVFMFSLVILSGFVCYYAPVLEHILEESYKERVRKDLPIPSRVKDFFKGILVHKKTHP